MADKNVLEAIESDEFMEEREQEFMKKKRWEHFPVYHCSF